MDTQEYLMGTGLKEQELGAETADELRQQMALTRTALSDKLFQFEDEIEQSVRSTVREVRGQIIGTVDEISGRVKNSVQSIQNTFDLRLQMQESPYRNLALALGAGYVIGSWLLGPRRSRAPVDVRGRLQTMGKGLWPLAKGVAQNVALVSAERLLQERVDAYLHGKQRKKRDHIFT